MSLVKILSQEPLPLVPENMGTMETRYIKNLHAYLRSLIARLTGPNIAQAIVEEGPPVCDKWLILQDSVPAKIYVDGRDWRGRVVEGGLFAFAGGTDIPAALAGQWPPDMYHAYLRVTCIGAEYASDEYVAECSNMFLYIEGGTGKLFLDMTDNLSPSCSLRVFARSSDKLTKPGAVYGTGD